MMAMIFFYKMFYMIWYNMGCEEYWYTVNVVTKQIILKFNFVLTDDLVPEYQVSHINCTNNRDRLDITNMRYHSFSIPDYYSAIVHVTQEYNFSSESLAVCIKNAPWNVEKSFDKKYMTYLIPVISSLFAGTTSSYSMNKS